MINSATTTAPLLLMESAQGRAWQREIENYYQNYCLIGLILGQAAGLSTHLTIQYITLQKQMKTTLEELLAEDELTYSTPKVAQPTSFYQRHTRVMRHINKQVNRLITSSYHE